MDWKMIPSLATLRAFEATARSGSFAEAARELNVTDAAVRQHVRALEIELAIPLVARTGRRISPTASGRDIANGLTGAFERIQRTIEDASRTHGMRPIRIALTPAFAETWLIPRLPAFWASHPDIQVDLAPSLQIMDLTEGEFDLAIRYGKGGWQDTDEQFLAPANYTVVASPRLMGVKTTDSVERLRDETWLFEKGRQEHRTWATEHGLDFDAQHNRFYPNNSLVLSAVRAGHGYSVQSYALIENDLESGTLVSVYQELNEALGYYLLCVGRQRRIVRVFMNWLLDVK